MRVEGNFTWDLLVRNLEEQTALYSTLLETLQSENKCLINHKVSELSVVINKKDKINEDVADKQYEMKRITDGIVISNEEYISIEKITELSPLSYKFIFVNLHKQLKEIGAAIYKYNYMNKMLIENSMKYISSMMKKIMEINSEEQTVYCNRGYKKLLGEEQNFMSIVA